MFWQNLVRVLTLSGGELARVLKAGGDASKIVFQV